MSDNLMAIIGIFVAVILMFIYPLISSAGKNDEIVQTVTELAVSSFVSEVTNTGKITETSYNGFVQKLYATGNSFDIQIEIQVIDDNPKRATSVNSSNLTENNKYYSVYTNAIQEQIMNKGEYLLKKNDYVVVTVKNTNVTIGTQLKNMLYNLIGKDTYTIGASSAGLVINGGV